MGELTDAEAHRAVHMLFGTSTPTLIELGTADCWASAWSDATLALVAVLTSFYWGVQGMRPRPSGSFRALASRGRARREFRGDEMRRQASERRRRESMSSGRLPNFPWR